MPLPYDLHRLKPNDLRTAEKLRLTPACRNWPVCASFDLSCECSMFVFQFRFVMGQLRQALSVLGKRIRLPAICARVPLRQLFKGVSGRGLAPLSLLDRAFPRTKSAKAKSLVMPFPRPVQLTQVVGSVSHVVKHLPSALIPTDETPAKNMNLCGMPSTQVQRAARRIAAGPLAPIQIPPNCGGP